VEGLGTNIPFEGFLEGYGLFLPVDDNFDFLR
jgi:hypothetical protein